MTNNFKQFTKSKRHPNAVFGYRSCESLVISDESGASRRGQATRLRSFDFAQDKSGQAALSLVFLIGGIALLVSVTMAVIAIGFLNSTAAFQAANRAYANATSGAQDALLKLVRDDSFSDLAGYEVPYVDGGCVSNCAFVRVDQVDVGKKVEIISTATVFASTRKIKVVASIDPNNGEVSVSSWTSLEL